MAAQTPGVRLLELLQRRRATYMDERPTVIQDLGEYPVLLRAQTHQRHHSREVFLLICRGEMPS